MPGVGFALGDVVLGLVLRNSAASQPRSLNLRLKFWFQCSMKPTSLIAWRLRPDFAEPVLTFFIILRAAKIAKQFKFGDRAGMRIAIVLGPDEISQGIITIKCPLTGDQHIMDPIEAIKKIHDILNNS